MFSTVYPDETIAGRRRRRFVGINLMLLGLGALPMAGRLSENGWTIAGFVLFVLFVVLLAQAVYGFALAFTGWWLLQHGGDPMRINSTLPPDSVPDKLPATAIVMPIFNEDVSRVFKGLRIMYESLQSTGRGDAFDFFILSDSSDSNTWIAEEKAWFELCKQVLGFGRIFYRKRRIPRHHKSGNIADFCRRWGAKYRYLIVLDADSVMTGNTFVRLASLMEHNPQAGIIQTCPRLALGRSLFQRMNQFACRVYGPVFIAGANYWQLDCGNFWGHNAIVRLKPFMKHCALPELPRFGPLGTRVLSHDTVEAAFMRRAGYHVWVAYDLEGSYEESPPHLLAGLQRDRRWCHGNLQHIWFLFSPGLKAPSRMNILIGIMAYVSGPLWLLFLLVSPLLFVGGSPGTGAGLLFASVMGLLLAPKALGAMLFMSSPEQRMACGGRGRIFLNLICETIFSMLLAPILMLFYTQFVWSSLFGASIGWGPQKRDDVAGLSWRACAAAHLGHLLLALGFGGLVVWLAPSILPWLIMVLLGPVVAMPFSRALASSALGLAVRKKGWFVVPEEIHPPWELQSLLKPLDLSAKPLPLARRFEADAGLLLAVLDPYLNALHVSLLRQRTQVSLRTRQYLASLSGRLLLEGLFDLTVPEKRALLWDADSMRALHQQLWRSPFSHLHDSWQDALRIYRDSGALTARRRIPAY